MDIDAYLRRIGFTGKADNSLATLQRIHLLHPCAIAFENLSSFLGQDVNLQPEFIFRKIVDQGRGGYCFEQNMLLAAVLKQLNFTVSEHAARVMWCSTDKTQMARTHMLLQVTVNGTPWIVDVGFGGLTMTAALKLESGLVQQSPHEEFMITQEGEEYCLSIRLKNNWKPMYIFDLVPQHAVDFEMANYFVSTYGQSMFRHNLILGRPDVDCRHALNNKSYTKFSLDGDKEETEIKDAEAFFDLLKHAFNIIVNDEEDVEALRLKFEKLG